MTWDFAIVTLFSFYLARFFHLIQMIQGLILYANRVFILWVFFQKFCCSRFWVRQKSITRDPCHVVLTSWVLKYLPWRDWLRGDLCLMYYWRLVYVYSSIINRWPCSQRKRLSWSLTVASYRLLLCIHAWKIPEFQGRQAIPTSKGVASIFSLNFLLVLARFSMWRQPTRTITDYNRAWWPNNPATSSFGRFLIKWSLRSTLT